MPGRPDGPGRARRARRRPGSGSRRPLHRRADLLPQLEELLAGKVVVDASNPLNADWSPLTPPGGRSAGERVQRWLPRSRVVKAFHGIFADAMGPRDARSGEPTTAGFLCGDDAEARATVAGLLRDLGFAHVDAGPLRCASDLEAMAHLNIQRAVGMGGGTSAIFSYHQPTDFLAPS